MQISLWDQRRQTSFGSAPWRASRSVKNPPGESLIGFVNGLHTNTNRALILRGSSHIALPQGKILQGKSFGSEDTFFFLKGTPPAVVNV